jgi:twitching motility two-component system response regulator PilG
MREGKTLRKITRPTIIGDDMSAFGAEQDVALDKFVLVIDDSITVRKIVETCLRRRGLDVVSFADGVEALQWLNGPQGRSPDLVLLDVTMPRMDGYEVARHLNARLRRRGTVIVMLTRRDGVIDRIKGRLVGAVDHLSKPFQTQQLLQVVTSHLGIAGAPALLNSSRLDD